MSLVFSNTTTKAGILQRIEQELGFPDGYITNDTTRLAQWTASVNLALDSVWDIIFDIAYGWQPDDINHTDYPIQFFNLISGQRDYSFTTDEDGNLIIDILKLAVKGSDGIFREIPTVDQQTRQTNNNDVSSFIDGRNTSGVPTRYDKTATGIFLDPIPNYNSSQGAKIFIQREGSYFATTDTTKKPGFSGLYHEYCVLNPVYRYARVNGIVAKETLKRDLAEMEEKISNGYGRRDRDMIRRMVPNYHSNK